MNIRNLMLFTRLSLHKNYSKTAGENNITPSALSRIIKGMEDELGFAICERNNRTVTITDKGKKLLDTANKIENIWSSYKSSLNKTSKLSGHLKIFSSVTASYSHLPELIKKINKISSELNVSVITGDHEMGIHHVLSNDVDISISIKPKQTPPNICYIELSNINLILIQPSIYDFSCEKKSFSEKPIILPAKGAVRGIIDNWLKQNSLRPPVFAEVTGNEIIANMVSLGFGRGIIPEPVLNFCPVSDKIKIIKDQELPNFSLGILYKNIENSLAMEVLKQIYINE